MTVQNTIERLAGSDRYSKAVKYGSVAYLAGITPKEGVGDIQRQFAEVLQTADATLAELGVDKSFILNAQILMASLDRDYAPMNVLWSEWLKDSPKPARTTCGARLARSGVLVEVVLTVALQG
ncbi:MAG TPA: RidA family protein [Castellaniella sp.]|uniref:RidA family protein n=1 Tax=Castellaniella sp. TaxID=1955812 RepID=UPI002F0F0DC8